VVDIYQTVDTCSSYAPTKDQTPNQIIKRPKYLPLVSHYTGFVEFFLLKKERKTCQKHITSEIDLSIKESNIRCEKMTHYLRQETECHFQFIMKFTIVIMN